MIFPWISQNLDWLETNRLGRDKRVTNIVFMGMGEPLDNVDAVVRAIRIITDPYGMAIGMRHVSVSTAGHLDGLQVLLDELPKVRLALSVQSIDSGLRSDMMPIEKKWPIAEVFRRLKRADASRLAPLLLQYTIIKGINDTKEDAERLIKLLRTVKAKINLIPFNEHSGSDFKRPSDEAVRYFQQVLSDNGYTTIVRFSKGRDISAA